MSAEPEPNCHRCLEEGRKRYAYFDIDGIPICIKCFLWEPITPAEQRRWLDYNSAHSTVTVAKKKGTLIEQPCEVCGSKVRVEAHHEDYSKPLDVRWLCNRHHRRVTLGKLTLPERRSFA
jgi:hypothetical protein